MNHKSSAMSVLFLALSSSYAVADGKSPWKIELETGLGYDSNAYLAPKEPYIDYAPAIPVFVDPVIHSGTFIPLGINLGYNGRSEDRIGMLLSYAFDGSIYNHAETKNANEYNHMLKTGVEILLNKEKKDEDTLRITPYFGIHNKTYFNRDTGDKMVSTVSGTDLSERYSYNVRGIEAELKQETYRLPHSLHVDIAHRDYVDPSSAAFDSYDYDHVNAGGDITFVIAKPTKLTLKYDYYTEKYKEWRARDLNGNYNAAGIPREYTFNKVGASLRQRLGDSFVIYLDYDVTDRKDNYVGYHDYAKNSYGMRAIYNKDQLRIKLKAVRWKRDYDNAFAFDNPTQAKMTYNVTEYTAKADYDLTTNHSLWTELKAVDQKSSDLRYQYDRYQAMIGWRWSN